MDLEEIRSRVLSMGGMAENQFHDAMTCLRHANADLARRIVENDDPINRLEVSLDDACGHLIVRRQPAANDLRTVMATIKIITDLERIGDEAVKIARTVIDAKERQEGGTLDRYQAVSALADGASRLLREALDTFARLDAKQAREIILRDAVIDREFKSIMRNLITFMMEDPRTISFALDALWAAKAIERIGDHAKNIAEYVVYIVEGKDIRHTDAHR